MHSGVDVFGYGLFKGEDNDLRYIHHYDKIPTFNQSGHEVQGGSAPAKEEWFHQGTFDHGNLQIRVVLSALLILQWLSSVVLLLRCVVVEWPKSGSEKRGLLEKGSFKKA